MAAVGGRCDILPEDILQYGLLSTHCRVRQRLSQFVDETVQETQDYGALVVAEPFGHVVVHRLDRGAGAINFLAPQVGEVLGLARLSSWQARRSSRPRCSGFGPLP